MRRVPFHPLLFTTFPIVFLFAQNAERVRGPKIVLPLIVVVATAVVLWGIAALVLRNVRRGAITASGLAILGLSYGHAWTAFQDRGIGGLVVGRDLFLFPLWCAAGAAVLIFAWRVKAIGEWTGILNAVAAGLVIMSIFNASTAVAGRKGEPLQSKAGEFARAIPKSSGDTTERDIYYLIFDRYGSRPVLDEHFNLDNSAFVGELRKRGLYVADESDSNYPTTAHSLASSLNMDYLDDLARRTGPDSNDWSPLYKTIVGPKVSRFLTAHGYRYAHIGPWYDPTANDVTAHVNYHYDKRSEFTRVLLETTVVQPIAKRVGLLAELDGRRITHNQILFQLDSILYASTLKGPTFTFAHILLPHEPFTFAADGSYRSEADEQQTSWDKSYGEQVQFANRRILEVLDELLAGPDGEDPIIVIQADEGPKFECKSPGTETSTCATWGYGETKRWEDASDDVLNLKFGILNALYLPDGDDAGTYSSMTPVNTFRLIFNHYFGTRLKKLPDDMYVYGSGKEPYRLTKVTDRVR